MYDSYVALGDSFTEGLDDRRPDGTFRGWADLVAAALAERTPGFRYANLAIRGRRLARIRDEQLPRAEAMRPALASISAGGNDLIGFRCDVAAVSRSLHEVLVRLVATGADVVVFTGFDLRGRVPLGGPVSARTAAYNAALLRSAEELGLRVVDLWTLSELYQDRMWSPDRLHLSTAGHLLVARAVLRVLGQGPEADDDPLVPAPRRPWISARRDDVEWARTYLAPWVGRQVRGRSLGDFVDPKLPELTPLPRVSPEDDRGPDGPRPLCSACGEPSDPG